MARADAALERLRRATPRPGDRRRVLATLAGISLLSLVLRVVQLGGRVFHWDEGRVGYWILRYRESGQFAYRPIIHGPFIQHADAFLFGFLPATDPVARLPVALVTAALPLSAWLLRAHLRDAEVVALGLFLALDPLLLYYSRFMRSDMLVGAFSFVAFAFLVRAYDTRDVRLVYPAAISMALAFSSKENALVYVACLVGAAVLLYDHRLVRAVDRGEAALDRARRDLRATRSGIREVAGPLSPAWWTAGNLSGAALCFVAVIVFMYAPRPALWNAVASPAGAPGVVESATLGSWAKLERLWLGGGFRDHAYLPFLADLLETLIYGSAVLLVFAALGFAVDGYAGRNRSLVAFATYWGAVSVVGYPVATDIQAPWTGVHVVLPLAIPAAVGAATLLHAGRAAFDAEDVAGVAVAGLVLTGGAAGVVAANADYWNSAAFEDRQVLQWAQPGNDLQGTIAKVEAVSREHRGVDVLFFGTRTPAGGNVRLYVENESSARQPPPGGPSWHSRLPLPWYLERAGAEVNSSAPDADPAVVLDDPPPVVISFPWEESTLRRHLDGYAVYRHDYKLWDEEIVIFIDRDAMREAGVEA